MADQWGGRRVTKLRVWMQSTLPQPCGKCGEVVHPTDTFVIGHKIDRWQRPDLMWDTANMQPEHKRCSDKTGQAAVIAKAKASAGFPHASTPGKPPPLPRHIHRGQSEPAKVRKPLVWSKTRLAKAAWLKPLLSVPQDAAPPLAMSPPHRRAVGSYGWEAIEWIRDELGIELRWWQKLAVVRQLERDKDGRLCWRIILESCPRRAGKSVRLRAVALWRLAHADLFGETQLCLHTGKDVAIVREIHRQAWRWASEREGWNVRKGVGQEEVFLGDHRWLVRSMDSVYGYDVCLGMIDEAWAVPPPVFEEGLEPATMERHSPQLLLTSTAHRRATTLMRRRIASALAADDPETLILLWAAPPGADIADPKTWRAASPHWSEDRARMIASKYQKALAGEADAEADDPDPMAGFTAQYCNVWNLKSGQAAKGTPLVDASWDLLIQERPDTRPDIAAIEGWFSDGVSLVQAWRTDDGVLVSASAHSSIQDAADALRAVSFKGTVYVGATLAEDQALKGLKVKSASGRTAATVKDLDRLLTEGVLFHDGGEHLTEQVRAIRTNPSADGLTMASRGRADAVKAAAWAAVAARTRSAGKVRVLLPTSA